MKKNLNIAYLNGAEGMIRRGTASSSGSGGDSGGETSTIEYLDVSGLKGTNKAYLVHFALYVKAYVENLNTKFSGFSAEYIDMVSNGKAVASTVATAIDFSHKVTVSTGIGEFAESTTMKGLLEVGITQEQLDAIPRITKEQFYSLE